MGDEVHGERVQAHLLCHHQQPQKALRRSLGKEFAKSMTHFTPNPIVMRTKADGYQRN
ncbi:MAG TPA: hypothetical protein VGH62_00080 [Bradyrhizobium sp.]|jgi:hypothetical protein